MARAMLATALNARPPVPPLRPASSRRPLTSAAARAQTTTGPPSPRAGQPDPLRIDAVGRQRLRLRSRQQLHEHAPQNLNPLGHPASDCVSNMGAAVQRHPRRLHGLRQPGGVWASLTSDCTASTDRGVNSQRQCVGGPAGRQHRRPGHATRYLFRSNIRVQDLVGWQQGPSTPARSRQSSRKGKLRRATRKRPSRRAINVTSSPSIRRAPLTGHRTSTRSTQTCRSAPAPTGGAKVSANQSTTSPWTANSDSGTRPATNIFIDPIPRPGEAGGTSLEGGQRLVLPGGRNQKLPPSDVDGQGDDDLLEKRCGRAPGQLRPCLTAAGGYIINERRAWRPSHRVAPAATTPPGRAITADGDAGDGGQHLR